MSQIRQPTGGDQVIEKMKEITSAAPTAFLVAAFAVPL